MSVLVSCLPERGVCLSEVSVLEKCGEVSVLVSCLSDRGVCNGEVSVSVRCLSQV